MAHRSLHGYIFKPTDKELMQYLEGFVLGKPLKHTFDFIALEDLYGEKEPAEIFGSGNPMTRYYFTELTRKCQGGSRFLRRVGDRGTPQSRAAAIIFGFTNLTGDLAKKRPQTKAEATSFGFDTVIFGFTNLTGDLAKKRPETRAEATSFGFDTVSDECEGNGSKLWLQADRREVTRLEGIQKQILAQDMMLPPKGVLK
nr:NAC domain-containing protein 78-like [Ipomoea batatas]